MMPSPAVEQPGLRSWAGDADFPLRVIRQENLGKPVAWSRGVAEAQGELFLSIDSDDACVPRRRPFASRPDRPTDAR